jgi:hypothetical protein
LVFILDSFVSGLVFVSVVASVVASVFTSVTGAGCPAINVLISFIFLAFVLLLKKP